MVEFGVSVEKRYEKLGLIDLVSKRCSCHCSGLKYLILIL